MANNPSDPKEKTYGAQSIRVMEGLEAVRKRPGMYIGSTGPSGLHHLVYEVVDNSVDEALGGHCDTIKVILHEDGSCSVLDNGRGIPTGIHPTEGISAAEVVMVKLHAGGKFDKDSYKFSGGLHGVGISVVNALSKKLLLTIYQDGKIHEQEYSRGKPLYSLKVTGTTDKRGTLVRFYPDAEIFTETTEFSFDRLAARLRELAFLNKGLSITIIDERHNKKETFLFEGGLVSFVDYINKKKIPLFPEILYFKREDEQYILECALQYNDGFGEQLFSFVNNINTTEGGTHVTGFKTALTKACNQRAHALGILKEGQAFSSDDVREGLVCVLSLKMPDPQFEGQTKTKLGSNDIKGIVSSWTFTFLDTYFEENPGVTKKILQKAELEMRARDAAKRARDITRRKNVLESTILPGKLTDCSEENPAKTELFIVEGDSAGGSAKSARDRATQAILPLRGKILNVEKARLDRALANEEIKALISAIGCGLDRDGFDIEKTRYHKIILMTDADVDGSHIRTLLLTLFFRYMRPLINHGYLYIAQPPLYKAKIGKKEQYLKDETEFRQFLISWAQENTQLSIDGAVLSTHEWHELLVHVTRYEYQLEKVSHLLHVPQAICDVLASTHGEVRWKEGDNIKLLAAKLQEKLKDLIVRPADDDSIVFELRNSSWTVNAVALVQQDLIDLAKLHEPLVPLIQKWTLTIVGKDKIFHGSTILDVKKALEDLSKPYMNVQRYKGLGEMNPEQLWETAMDPERRTLLQVTIDDAFKADTWFNTLMGDDVSGRRDFIIEGGHFVKNLDV